jgi:23S rRNA pseudouridine2605 synthase
VDGQPLGLAKELVYIAIYKPRGVISTVTSPDPRPTVRDLIDLEGHLYPVGRLDVDSEGLMLLTNDGELANRLTHPRYGHEKEYQVLVARHPDEEQLATWRRGVVLPDGYRTAPANVQLDHASGKGMWLRVIMKEGRKRQIRETGTTIGLPVVKIIRTRIGSLYLGSLKPRQWRYLTADEVEALKQERKPGRLTKRTPAVAAPTTRRPAVPKRASAPSRGTSKPSSYSNRSSQSGKPHPSRRPNQTRSISKSGAYSSKSGSPGKSPTPYRPGQKKNRSGGRS